MPSLCTLDLSNTDITFLPDSICDKKSLKALLLGGCRELEIVPNLGELKALRELDLSETAIKKVPQGVEDLLDLRVLLLNGYSLEILPRELLLKLRRLQHITFPYRIPVPVEELKDLKLLEGFSGRLENVNDFNCFSRSLGHDTYYRILGGSFDPEFLSEDEYLAQDYTNELILSECNLKDEKVLGQGIVHLQVNKCEGMSICFVDLFSSLNYPTSLKSLIISRCGGTECILRSEQGSSSQISKTLEVIRLIALEDLKEVIQKGEIGASSPAQPVFSSLKSVFIDGCNKMRKVGSVVLELPNLTDITISECEEIEEIFDAEGRGCVSLPRLKNLSLSALPKLRKLGLSALSPNLESITIGWCREIEEIFDDEGRGCVSLPRLKELWLSGLPRLRKLGLSALSPNLERIIISECGEIEEIFEDEGRGSITLSTLDQLTLFCLPKLQSICRSTMICNSIRVINIVDCPRLTKKLPVHVDDLPPPTLKEIAVDREWWESLEWENPSLPHNINHLVNFDHPYLNFSFNHARYSYLRCQTMS